MKNKILLLGLSTLLFSSCSEEAQQEQADKNIKEIAVNEDKNNDIELPVTQIPNVTNGAEAYFSPDGKTLIFNGKMGEDKTHKVYTVNVDGSDLRKINGKGDDACSHFAPDGKSIIWTSTRDNTDMHAGNYSDSKDYPQGAELFISELDGSDVKRITNNKYYDAEVGYRPDGKRILFSRQIDGKLDLWTMDVDGSNQTQITFTDDWQEGGAFYMPNGKTILYRAWKKGDEDKDNQDMQIFTINEDGNNLKQITNEAGTHWAPFPAPDGDHFAYVKVLQPHNFEIILRSLKTGKEKQLTYSKSFDGFPAFTADGKTMSFSSSRANAKGVRSLKLFTMDVSSLNLGVKN
jgi:Tol biopolymer transport system component